MKHATALAALLALSACGHGPASDPSQADLVCKDLRAQRPTLTAPIAVTYRSPSLTSYFGCNALPGGEIYAAVDAEAIALGWEGQSLGTVTSAAAALLILAGWHHHHGEGWNAPPPLASPHRWPCQFQTPTLDCQWSGRQTYFVCNQGGAGRYRTDPNCPPPF